MVIITKKDFPVALRDVCILQHLSIVLLAPLKLQVSVPEGLKKIVFIFTFMQIIYTLQLYATPTLIIAAFGYSSELNCSVWPLC